MKIDENTKGVKFSIVMKYAINRIVGFAILLLVLNDFLLMTPILNEIRLGTKRQFFESAIESKRTSFAPARH